MFIPHDYKNNNQITIRASRDNMLPSLAITTVTALNMLAFK